MQTSTDKRYADLLHRINRLINISPDTCEYIVIIDWFHALERAYLLSRDPEPGSLFEDEEIVLDMIELNMTIDEYEASLIK